MTTQSQIVKQKQYVVRREQSIALEKLKKRRADTRRKTEEAFCKWRVERSSRAELTPEELWAMALRLYPHYKRSKICERLRLRGSQFKRRLEGGGDTRANHGFVLASRNVAKATHALNSEIQLTLQGHTRSMTLCFDVHALGQVLPLVGALL